MSLQTNAADMLLFGLNSFDFGLELETNFFSSLFGAEIGVGGYLVSLGEGLTVRLR